MKAKVQAQTDVRCLIGQHLGKVLATSGRAGLHLFKPVEHLHGICTTKKQLLLQWNPDFTIVDLTIFPI